MLSCKFIDVYAVDVVAIAVAVVVNAVALMFFLLIL
jgi:hypothetical protein